jgi:putative spermidine/putrescine transport system substrate-binding protein
MMFRRIIILSILALFWAIFTGTAPAAETATCYNCPPEWADWASQLKAIKESLGIEVPDDNKNSGQTLSQLIAEKSHPVAGVAYFCMTFGIMAKEAGVLAPSNPAKIDDVPANLKDPDGTWFTIHSGALGLFVNKDALGGKPVPRSWKDLLKPEYKGMVGYNGAVAVNLAMGGSLDNFDPAIQFFK